MPASLPLHPVCWLPERWGEQLASWAEPRYRTLQLFHWIHARGVMDPEAMSDLPKTLRARLATEGLASPLAVDRTISSADGSRKLVLRAVDGACVETVLLPALPAAADDDADRSAVDEDAEEAAPAEPGPVRVTQCVSTQVGCAMGCVFCASGAAGLRRNLGAEEIVAQVLTGRSSLSETETLRNVLFMGMGEPLHNFEATARAITLLMHPEGLALGARRITVSTAGLVPGIVRLDQELGGKIGLAVSLHGARDETRSALAPIGRKYPLATLIAALRRYRLPSRRRITIEYTLIRARNDSVAEARALARLLRGLRVKVNLIPLNPIPGATLAPSPPETVAEFQQVLVDEGYLCFVRRRRGDDVAAACGQLALGTPLPAGKPKRRPRSR